MLIDRQLLFILLLPIFFTACAVGPDYKRPSVAISSQFKEAKGKTVAGKTNKNWKIATPRDDFDRGEWWRIFNDNELNKLEAQLNISNQNIATAYANYRQACALVDEARASFFPTLNLNTSVTRQKSGSGTTSFSSISSTGQTSTGAATGGGGSSSSSIATNHSLIIEADWSPDIWGQVRRTVEASVAGAQASAALLANTRLSAQGSLAQFYFQLRALDTDQKLLDDTVKNYKKTLQLTRNQYASGVAARADVIQAQSQLESAQSLAINNKIDRATFEHAIAVLIGMPPANFSLSPMPLTKLPPAIPLTVPSALLERRPDIAQAERLMAQANAQIGVAIAAYFPTLTLSANINNSGRGAVSDLFSLPPIGWAYGPQITELLYDGGLRAATVAAARAGYDSTIASYRQIVLTAFQNVEDNLAQLRILADQAVVQNAAAADARKALKLVINQYKAGTVPYSSVITAQTNAYNAEKSAADINGLRMTTAVGLVLALGGGWDAQSIKHIV